MVFSTTTFLFLFLPITFIGYYVLPQKIRNTFLFIASLIFYGWGGLNYLRILLASLIWNYAAGLLIDRFRESRVKKPLFVLGLAGNIGLLVRFKYLSFIAEIVSHLISRTLSVPEILLPIGISFYTFQAVSYVIEVYWSEAALNNPIDLGMYITLFPQLIAGPIVRYRDIKTFIHDRKADKSEIFDGFERFLIGLCKKVLLANALGLLTEDMIDPINYDSASILLLWIKAAAYSLQLYYDFSGYSDMAIGLGHMFGFSFPENFIYPYCAASFKDFWKRWHITLTEWFRTYIYFPLGGSRKGTARHILNLFIVWSLSGLWHGAAWTFVLWGLFYFLLLTLEKYVIRPERFTNAPIKILYRIFTIVCVICNWVIFRIPVLEQAVDFILGMMGGKGIPLYNTYALFTLQNNKVLFPAAILLAMPVIPSLRNSRQPVLKAVYYVGLAAAVVLAIASILLDAYNPFLYFQF